MKISKLTIAALLTMSLVVTGCNSKKSKSSSDAPSSESSSGSQVDPVTRIKVTSLTRALIVGEQINLDDYVSVVGGEGPKVFTVQLVSGEGVVSLEGKNLKALAEGSFALKIIAGTMDANFAGKVYSQLRADLESVLLQTPTGYAVQQYEYNNSGEMVISAGQLNIHHEDYYAGPSAVKNDEGTAYVTGGMLKAANGKTYEFAVDDLEAGANLSVRPKILSDFSHWSTNIDVTFDISALQLQKDEETGEEYFTLAPDALPLDGGWSGIFDNYIDLYVAGLFDAQLSSVISYYSAYELEYLPLVFRQIQLSETKTAFGVEASLYSKKYSMALSVVAGYFIVGGEVPDVTSVRAYIDAGNFPDPIPFTEYGEKVNSAATAKNYQVTIQNGWMDRSTLAFVDYNTAISALTGQYAYSWEDAWPDATETVVVTENGTYSEYVQTKHYNEETHEALETPVVKPAIINGMIEHSGSVYEYRYNSETTSYTTNDLSAASIWTSGLKQYVAAGLVPGEDFQVTSREDLGEGNYSFEIEQDSASALFPSLVRQSFNFSSIEGALNQAFEGDYLGYISIYAFVTNTSLTYIWQMRAGSKGYFGQRITISAIDGGNTLPVSEAEIFPTA